MSESEGTAGVGTTTVEGEKVKAINGVKEVDQDTEVRLQNGDSEKPQINGDVGKDETLSEVAHNGDSKGNEDVVEEEEEEEEEEKDKDMESQNEKEEKVEKGEEEEEEEDAEKQSKSDEKDKEKEEGCEKEKEKDGKEVNEGKESEQKEEEEAMEVDSEVKKESSADKTDDKSADTEKDEKVGDKKENKSESADKKKDVSKSDSGSGNNKENTKEGEDPPKTKKEKKEKEDPPPSSRQLRVRKTPKKYTEDDDDVKITEEVIRDDSSDIEMIEESDPLAISDADVKKAQQKDKKEVKTKDPNVIIIDTNTLLKNQGNLAAAVAQSTSTPVSTVTQTSSPHTPTVSNVNIQTAIQAITGGVPAQGLQSAYITALQQDDAYVIEAPSFIVPYVMEGKPKEPIQKFLRRIKKEQEDYEKKQKEEEEKKKAEEEKKKKAEEKAEKGEEEEEEEKEEEEDKEKEKEKEKEEKAEKTDKAEKEDKEEKDKKEEEEKTEEEDKEAKEKKGEKDGKIEKSDKEEEEKQDNEKNKDKKMEVDEKDVKENGEEKEEKEKEKEEEKEEKKEKEKEESEKDKKGAEVKEAKDDKTKDVKEITKKDDEDKENKNKEKKEGGAAPAPEQKEEDMSHLGKWEPYYRSALGKFFLDLGLNQAQEFLQSDLLRMQKKKFEKMKTSPSKEGILSVKLLEKQLGITREKNAHLHLPLKTCKFCNFKTESEMVLDRHLESPHMVNYTYKCNFCEFETRGPQVILFHMEAEHNVRGRLERAPAFFQCSLCPYEDNNKSKMTRHSFSCSKKYKPEKNCELIDWEPPAKIPKVHRGRPNTLGKAFEPVKMPNLLPKGLSGMNINIQSAVASNILTSASAAAAGRGRGRPVGSYKNTGQITNQGRIGTTGSGSLLYQARGVTTTGNLVQQVGGTQQFTLGNQMFQSTARVPRILPSSSASPVSLIPGLAASSSITIQSVQSKAGNTKSPQQPSISITPLPRAGQQAQSISKGATPTRDSSGKPSFVICEICDGYIKDLEQLRNHMNLIHKVKIHPKMIYNRPPLNCQKCQHRFFTDQGLERHLLGTHGLVTSSMQEAANKGKDAGRCPICGKVFQWKLLNHVSRDHKMTLKPAHLSYKCTVCTATFNMYRLFENHVYSAHSVVNKNKGESGKKQSSGTGTNESPLKINDEITIIPQPASKNAKSDKPTPTKKGDSTPTVSKEITITKVGSRPTRRSAGSSVEVISLDESPSKNESSKKRGSKDNSSSNAKRARTSS